jgi:hypothetical protein
MKQTWLFRALGLAVIAVMLGFAAPAQTGDTAAVQQKLNSQFKLTTITADRSDIVTAGDVIQIHKPGLLMYGVTSPLPPSNTYKSGRIGQGWSGFGKDLVIGMAAPGGTTAAQYPHRQFVPEEKCWVTGIQVQRDGVLFQLYSDPYDDIRYYANLKIPFPDKKTMPPVDVVAQMVTEVLTAVPQDNQSNPAQDSQQAALSGMYANANPNSTERFLFQSNGTFTKFVGNGQGQGQFTVRGDTLTLSLTPSGTSFQLKIQGDKLMNPSTRQVFVRTGDAPAPAPEVAAPAPAPAPMPDIVPPPPPADAPPPTIALGQTKDQVTGSFGPPLRMANLGGKVIFYYKDMKVTFTNGKVSNVE